jgi:hypothetical protein
LYRLQFPPEQIVGAARAADAAVLIELRLVGGLFSWLAEALRPR